MSEGRVRLFQPDCDPPRPVVGLDARDIRVGIALLLIVDGADDPLVQRRTRRAEAQDALQPMLEVAGLHAGPVRIVESAPEPNAVGRSVGRA